MKVVLYMSNKTPQQELTHEEQIEWQRKVIREEALEEVTDDVPRV